MSKSSRSRRKSRHHPRMRRNLLGIKTRSKKGEPALWKNHKFPTSTEP
jgi:hypothetical protein